MKATSIQGTTTEEIRGQLQQCLENGHVPTLAIVFLSRQAERESLCALMKEHHIRTFGVTTSGGFISPEIIEDGIAIMLLDIDPSAFDLVFVDTAVDSPYASAMQLGKRARQSFQRPAFIIATGWLHTEGELIIQGIAEGAGAVSTVFGAMAGDDFSSLNPFVFTEDVHSPTGMMAIVLDEDKIDMKGVATCGWKPIGVTKTITRCEGHIIYTIDHQPALDLLARYLGLDIDQDTGDSAIVNLGAYYPLQVEREGARPVMRSATLGNKADRSLICSGNVTEGSVFRFSLPPDFDVIDTVVAECTDLKNTGQPEADAVIMFSCISRFLAFGMLTHEEIERVQQVWNAPFIGIFSFGEFGKSNQGNCEFHNNTCCLVALKEK